MDKKEKERYEEIIDSDVFGVKDNQTYGAFYLNKVVDLLNQQDKRIKELEENLKNEKQLHNLCIEDNQKYKDFLRRQILSLMLEIDL